MSQFICDRNADTCRGDYYCSVLYPLDDAVCDVSHLITKPFFRLNCPGIKAITVELTIATDTDVKAKDLPSCWIFHP